MVIEIPELLAEAQRLYLTEDLQEFEFPVRRPTGNPQFYEELDIFLSSNTWIKTKSFRIVKEGFVKMSRPSLISYSAEELIKRHPEVLKFKSFIDQLKSEFSKYSVKAFIQENYNDFLIKPELFSPCFHIFNYLLENRSLVFGLLPRQIPHGQSTKIIGKENLLLKLFSFHFKQTQPNTTWKDFYKFFGILFRPIEFRFFAPICSFQNHPHKNFYGLWTLSNREDFDFSRLQSTLIVENLEPFYRYYTESKNTLIIDGGGWKVAHLVSFFHKLPKPVFYWGDIDKEGLEILGYLKEKETHLQGLLMNFQALEKFSHLIQKKTSTKSQTQRPLLDLQEFYCFIVENEIQIEQEQLNVDWPLHPQVL